MDSATPNVNKGIKQAGAGAAAAIGGLGGAVLGGAMTARDGKSTEALRGKVQQMESQQGGFIHALNLAQAKSRLAMSEVAEKHPVAATLTGSLMGASMGASVAPHISNIMGK